MACARIVELYSENCEARYCTIGGTVFRLVPVAPPEDWGSPDNATQNGLAYRELQRVENRQEQLDALVWLFKHRQFVNVFLRLVRPELAYFYGLVYINGSLRTLL